MLVVDAVVDDGDLDAVTARARQPGERGAPMTDGPRFRSRRYV